VKAILTVEDSISTTLSDIVELIARDSYDMKWTALLPELVSALAADDPVATLRVFRTA
jgi:hypothetical protein